MGAVRFEPIPVLASGRVVDRDGHPIAGASIGSLAVMGTSGTRTSHGDVHSDAEGFFVLTRGEAPVQPDF